MLTELTAQKRFNDGRARCHHRAVPESERRLKLLAPHPAALRTATPYRSSWIGIRLASLLFLPLVLTFFATGCVRNRLAYRAPEFQWTDFQQRGFAIGGVSGLSKNSNMAEVFDLMLCRQLARAHPHVPVTPLAEVRRILGAEQHDVMVAKASEKIGPTDRDLLPLAALRDRARYVLWIHLGKFRSSTGNFVSETKEWESTYNSTTKTYEHTERVVSSEPSADVFARGSALVSIYDLQRERIVWAAQSRGSSYAMNKPDAAGELRYPADPGPLSSLVDATLATLKDWK